MHAQPLYIIGKSVSKPWEKIIKNPMFIKEHYERNKEAYGTAMYCKQLIRSDTFSSGMKSVYFFCVCRGLVCLGNGNQILVWNPATLLLKQIPESSTSSDKDNMHNVIGFGFNDVDRFLLLKIAFTRGNYRSAKVDDYTSSSGKWSSLRGLLAFGDLSHHTDINDNPHCLEEVQGKGNSDSVAKFDTVSKKFTSISLPRILMWRSSWTLVNFEGQRALLECIRDARRRLLNIEILIFDPDYGWKVHSRLDGLVDIEDWIGLEVGECMAYNWERRSALIKLLNGRATKLGEEAYTPPS